MDKSTLGGILIALVGIGCGLVLEGGRIIQVVQPTAALIVIGGTIGAVMVQFPLPVVIQAILHLKDVFVNVEPESDELIRTFCIMPIKPGNKASCRSMRNWRESKIPF